MRDDLVALLTRAVSDGLITEDEAAALLARFDAGELDVDMLPIPPGEAVSGLDGTEEAAALALLLLLLGGGTTPAPATALTRLSPAARASLLDIAQGAFEARAAMLAQSFADGALTLAEWQGQMAEALREHLVQQALVGSGRTSLSPAQLARIDAAIRRETAYLSRFADTIAVRQTQGNPLTVGQIANRAELYGGAGRAEFYRSREEAESPGAGYVVHYISQDDSGTCSPCLAAEQDGPYLPGEGPMPGEVCLGRSRCRCRREIRRDPGAYARLTGG